LTQSRGDAKRFVCAGEKLAQTTDIAAKQVIELVGGMFTRRQRAAKRRKN
jgi:hypothetical protein